MFCPERGSRKTREECRQEFGCRPSGCTGVSISCVARPHPRRLRRSALCQLLLPQRGTGFMASRRLPLVFIALIDVVASGYATLGTGKDLDPNSNTDWLGVIAGDDAGSETELAAEMAELFASQAPFRVTQVPGDSGLQNISRLLNDPHIDAGFVSTDVLADAKTQGAVPNLADRLQVVARFCPQEVHVLT